MGRQIILKATWSSLTLGPRGGKTLLLNYLKANHNQHATKSQDRGGGYNTLGIRSRETLLLEEDHELILDRFTLSKSVSKQQS